MPAPTTATRLTGANPSYDATDVIGYSSAAFLARGSGTQRSHNRG